jgi:hypothetical protein
MVSDYAKLAQAASSASFTSSNSPIDVEIALEDSAAKICRLQVAAKAAVPDQLQGASNKFNSGEPRLHRQRLILAKV